MTGRSTGDSGPLSADPEDLHASVDRRLALHDYRYTNGRRQLVDAISAAGQPVTMPDIVDASPGLPPSSVYRNLEVLERCGVVKRISTTAGHAHFEFAEPLLSHHHHLVCLTCGAVEDVRLDDEVETQIMRSLDEAASHAGFTPMHHDLELHGRCAGCP